MDNRTAVAYVNKMRGTPVPPSWPTMAMMPPERNPFTCRTPSRNLEHSSRPGVSHQQNGCFTVFLTIQPTLGFCQVDLFATRLNHQLSWRLDPFAQVTDALRLNCRNLGLHFPSLLPGRELPAKVPAGCNNITIY